MHLAGEDAGKSVVLALGVPVLAVLLPAHQLVLPVRGAAAVLCTQGAARSAERSFVAPVAAVALGQAEALQDAVSRPELVEPPKP